MTREQMLIQSGGTNCEEKTKAQCKMCLWMQNPT